MDLDLVEINPTAKPPVYKIMDLKVHLIDNEGGSLGTVSLSNALIAAKEVKSDLVEINPTAKPPVYKIMDLQNTVIR